MGDKILVTHVNDYGLRNGGAEIFLRDLHPYLKKVAIRESICLTHESRFDSTFASEAPFPIRRGVASDVNDAVRRGDALLCWGGIQLNRVLSCSPRVCVFNNCAEAFDQLRGCDKFVTHVIAANSNIASVVGKSHKFTKILPGVEPRRFSTSCGREEARRRLGVSASDFVVGMVGRIDEQKRQTWLIEAMKQLGPGVVAVFVGEGRGRAAAEASAPASCRFLGHQGSIGDWYSAFDASCLLSSTEGCSAVMFESMFWGVPLLATPVGAALDVLQDGANCLLVSSVEDLVAALRRLMDQPNLRAGLMEGGRATFDAIGHISQTAKKWEDIFDRLDREKPCKSFL